MVINFHRYDVREKLLKQTPQKTNIILKEYKEEWKRTSCIIISHGWTNKKTRSLLLSGEYIKEIVFLYSLCCEWHQLSRGGDQVSRVTIKS